MRMAALWAHLPRESRTVARRSPDSRWSEGDWMLWRIEPVVGRLAWWLSVVGA